MRVRLPAELADDLQVIATREGATLTALVRDILLQAATHDSDSLTIYSGAPCTGTNDDKTLP